MKVSLNWLKNYIDISDLNLNELVEGLTNAGLEVESVEEIGKGLENFIVGEVVERQKHPNADKLSVCTVYTGKENLQVVCGAPNVAQGQKIVFAPVNTIIPNSNEKLKKAKIRGVESNGMICSDRELGLGEDHSGIKVLGADAIPGLSILDYLQIKDYIFEVGITPNRPDALSHIGVARDIAAIYNKTLKQPSITIKESKENINDLLKVKIENAIDCPRYCARYVKNVKIKESPNWLKNYLTNVGLRPLNNVVDISNFVMMEYGQPLHTFDANLIEGNEIIIKNASEGQEFTTLDEKVRSLKSTNLLICDSKKAIAIAGVMGGHNSEISNATKNVIIESAYFNPVSIRKTSKELQLSTDSSFRFERGVDYGNTLTAANRAAQLIAELGDGEIVSGWIDEFPNKFENLRVQLRYERINSILGTEIPQVEVKRIVEKLGFEIVKEHFDVIECIVPTYRPDCTREIDLIEEVARIYGYDNIDTLSRININPSSAIKSIDFDDISRDIMIGFGFSEVLNNSLVSEESSKFADFKGVQIINPISSELSFLRTSLIPGILTNIAYNKNRGENNLKLFEIGNCFLLKTEKVINFEDFTESTYLTIGLTGLFSEKGWSEKSIPSTIYHLKGVLDSYFKKISLDNVLMNSYYREENKFFDIEIKILHNENYLGSLYKISSEYLKSYDIAKDVFIAELDLVNLQTLEKRDKKYKKISSFPKVERDISFFIDKSYLYKDIKECVMRNSDRILKNVLIFDQFINAQNNEVKSISLRFEFQSDEKTLTTDEVEKRLKKIITGLENEFKIQLRDS